MDSTSATCATLRSRSLQDYQAGEHVWVDACYFDDLKVPEELKFSATRTDKKTYGVILSVSNSSCKIIFDDDEISNVPKSKINLLSNIPKTLISYNECTNAEDPDGEPMRDIPNEESDEESTEVADDPDWVEEETTEVVDDPDWVEVNDDFESENEGSDNDRLYYLM